MDKAALKTAVEYLIGCTKYIEARRSINEAVDLWAKRPMTFAGDLAVLNPLIDLGVASPEALANVFALVERKRRTAPSARKVDYQRDYMRQRRVRINKAVRLEEIVRGKRMTPEERKAYGIATLANWIKQRQEWLGQHSDASWKERNELAGQFWKKVDDQLDHDLSEAEKVLAAPGHRKVRRLDVREPKGVLGQKLKEALDKRRR